MATLVVFKFPTAEGAHTNPRSKWYNRRKRWRKEEELFWERE